jgi:hypothetical protein
MTIGTSIVLIAVGAILAYAVESDPLDFIDIQTAGVILMIVGVVGLILSLLYTFVIAGRRDRDVVEEVPVRRRERL